MGVKPSGPYNVLFIAVDDLNDWVGCLGGHPQARTPHIDRLAERGVLFERAYCPAPLCNPSRSAILTGLSPATTGIYNNKVWFRDLPEFKDWVTLPPYKADDLADVPEAGRKIAGTASKVIKEHGQWRPAVPAYLASCSFADACVGHLLEALNNSPYKDNTIVVLWGDHGWHLGEKSHWSKSALWEEATRTPLIVAMPGVTKKLESCPHPVSLIDLHATLIELCDLPPREDIESRSLVPLIKKPTRTWSYPALMTHGYQNHAVRNERYRYIRYANGDEELYDHQRDPNGWTNLAYRRDHAQIKMVLKAWLPIEDAEAR